jgi:uncharacterized protein
LLRELMADHSRHLARTLPDKTPRQFVRRSQVAANQGPTMLANDRRNSMPERVRNPLLSPDRQDASGLAGGSRQTAVSYQLALAVGGAVLIVLYASVTRILSGPNLAEIVAIFLASTLSSIAGFAFSAISGAMLFHVDHEPVHIVQVMIVCSIAIQLFSVITLRNAIEWNDLGRFLLSGMFGLPVGVYLLTHLAAAQYMRLIGVFLIVYGAYMLLRKPASTIYISRAADHAVGFLGGVTGGLAGFPGAFVTIWCGWKGWSKDRQRGVYQPFILIMQVFALGLITFTRSSHAHGIDISALMYVPGAVLGTWCGIAIFRRLTDRQFAGMVNLLLIVSGAGLLA